MRSGCSAKAFWWSGAPFISALLSGDDSFNYLLRSSKLAMPIQLQGGYFHRKKHNDFMKQQWLPRERGFLGGQIFKENMVLCPSRVLFLIACFLILVKKNSILKQKRYFEAISNRRDILKQSQRWQFRSACSASLGLRTALPSPSWFALGPTSSSSAGIVQWIMFTVIKTNTHTKMPSWFAPLRTSFVHSHRNLQT